MNLSGSENFQIELVDEITCHDKQDLKVLEGYYILQLGTLNHNVAGRTIKDWRAITRSGSCGKTYTMTNAARHKNTNFHMNNNINY